MKHDLFAAASVAALVVGSGTASAQPVVVSPAPVVVAPSYSPGVTIGGTIAGRGFAIGGGYSSGPALYAGPTVVPVVPVPVAGYGRPYYYPPYCYYHHHHHYPHYRW